MKTSKKTLMFRGASSAALVFCLAAVPALAQQAPAPSAPVTLPDAQEKDAEPTQAERVIVTGTNIVGSSESAALPVEVFTQEDNLKQGNQTALELVKSLTASGETLGEANIFIIGTQGYGSSNVNLRGLGGGRTLTIFNGRRFSQNTNMIPQAALARTEILKDGGAVIYGADATGGVVNFITRDDFDGLIVDGEYKAIRGSDGDYNASVLWGKDFDNGNIMFSAEISHRSELPLSERAWAYHTYQENSAQYTPYSNYSMYTLRNAAGGSLGPVTDFTQAQCEASGSGPLPGFFQANTFGAGLNSCWWNYPVHYIDIVDEYDQVRTYLQVVNDLSDSVRFTGSLAYGKSDANDISAVPGYNPNLGPAPAPGALNQFRVPASNPAFAAFLAQNNITTPGVAFADVTAPIFWGISGAPGWGDDGTTPTTQLENWNAVAALEGDFGDFGGDWLNSWKASMTYNLYTSTTTQGDNVTYRIQEALNGFGGPNCHARDLVPDNFNIGDTNGDGVYSTAEIAAAREQFYATIGTQNAAEAGKNGCLYMNPFSNAFARNAVFGGANPRYIPGFENDPALTNWIFDDRQQEDQTANLTFDALVNGVTPLSLPGGQVAWAAGAQWRQAEVRESTTSPYLDPDTFPCQWPGQRPGQLGCSGVGESPYGFWTQDNQESSDQQQYSYFGELRVPVYDNLSFQLALRREEFPRAGLGATVYKVAGMWDPLSWLAIRGSYGTNYATPSANIVPGEITGTIVQIARSNNAYLRGEVEYLSSIKPETADVSNLGAIFTFDNMPLDGRMRFSVDYFNFKIKDELKTVAHNTIVNSLVASSTAFVNCSSPLIERISFRNGPGASGCIQNTTIGADITGVRSIYGNGPGADTSGIDYDFQYAFGLGAGELTLGLTATQTLTYEVAPVSFLGLQIATGYDAVGFANYSRDAGLVSEWRSNATVNYNIGDHNFRYVLRYIQGVTDERFLADLPPNSVFNPTAATVRDSRQDIDDFVTQNLYYQWTVPFTTGMTLNLSVENVLDEDPPFVQAQGSYDPWIGNGLGRTIEVGFRKQF